MALTQQQELFAQFFVATGHASEAYKKAYPKSQKWKESSVNEKASKLKAKIKPRIEELKAELANKFLWTREQSTKALIGVINSPDKSSDIVAAVKVLNDMEGFTAAKKHEITGANGGAIEVKHIISFIDADN